MFLIKKNIIREFCYLKTFQFFKLFSTAGYVTGLNLLIILIYITGINKYIYIYICMHTLYNVPSSYLIKIILAVKKYICAAIIFILLLMFVCYNFIALAA